MRRISSKPLNKQTYKQLCNSFWSIYKDCCKRNDVSAFDWPTLNVVFPNEYTRLKAIMAEARTRPEAPKLVIGHP